MATQQTRRILIQKGPNGLGFSVKGGGDVQLPLVVSRVESGGGAVGLLKIGMEISAVNGISLEGLPHYAAVEILRRTRSPVILFVRNSTRETAAIVDNNLLESESRFNTLQSRPSSSGTMRSSHSKSEYETEYKLYYGNGCERIDGRLSGIPSPICQSIQEASNADLYDLRTVKRFVKEILHLPKEVFARKLAWKFPPVALGKFHKWLLSKLQRFDCEAPQNAANFIFDAFSQSLYLSRAIYDLVHLIRTLMAMERTGIPTKPPLQPAPGTQQPLVPLPHSHAELHNPNTMASFLSELSEIKSQLARAKEEGNHVLGTQAHINQQNAEIKALREQLMSYEARISALTNNPTRNKDSDLGTFFKENFKRIKNKTMKRRQSLTGQGKTEGKVTVRGGPKIDEQGKENCPDNAVRSPQVSVKSISSNGVVTSTPTLPVKNGRNVEEDGSHNEIFVHMGGDQVVAHSLQVLSNDSLAQQPRDRLYSSDDDYVQMNGEPSPRATLNRIIDPLKEEEPAMRRISLEDEPVIRRISRDYKRSSVSSSNSKVSIESLKLKHKQTIMIDSDECEQGDEENEDYMQMDSSENQVRDQHKSSEDGCEDYVEPDDLLKARKVEHPPVPADSEAKEEVKKEKKSEEKKSEEKKEDVCAGSDTVSTGTLQADVNVIEERQINATQVTEISRDVDSIMVDVETLHRMEQHLIKPSPPPLLPKPTLRNHSSPALLGGMTSPSPLSHCSGGGMVKAHEVPIYAKVERMNSNPPPPRIRPFSFGEASNSSSTSQNEMSRHEVCSTKTTPNTNIPPPRKTSLTSNGSSVEVKSDYSSDRPSSYNTSQTASCDHGDRSSRKSSDLTPDENQRLSIVSDNKSDGVFGSPVKNSRPDPLSEPLNGAAAVSTPDKPPRDMVRESHPHLEPVRSMTLSSAERRARHNSGAGVLNVSFDVIDDLEDCKDKEVGEEFFNRGKKEKKTPFKKILSFGKGKKKQRSSSSGEQTLAAIKPRQPEIRNMEGRGSLVEDFKHSPHFSVERPSLSSRPGSSSSSLPIERSRDNSGASSSHSSEVASCSGLSRHSTISSSHSTHNQLVENCRHSASIHSGDYASPADVSSIRELEMELEIESEIAKLDSNENLEYGKEFDERSEHLSNSSVIYPGDASNDSISNDGSRKSSKGFYDDLGVSINFDKIPVAEEPILDLTNEIIIDLDGDVIKNQEELKVLREKSQSSERIIVDNDMKGLPGLIMNNSATDIRVLNGGSPLSPVGLKRVERIMDSNLTAKVETEIRINNECNEMVQEIERLNSPPPVNENSDPIQDNQDLHSPSPSRTDKTPSPSFSEIDALLGDLTADLDNLSF